MAEEWIQKATAHNKGSLRALAKEEGAMGEGGTIKKSWLRKKAKQNDHVGRQARLALTLEGMHHGRS